MTARHQLRVGARLANRERSPIDATPAPSVGDTLAAARERKGVDLFRAERDTKIRARFLDALERDDYAELPGAVYTKGFLRNYAVYLGLDPDEIVALWRRESLGARRAPEKVEVAAPPRPIHAPRTGFTFTRGIVVAALLTLVVFGFAAYVAVQLFRFSQPPQLTLTQPTVVSEATTGSVTMSGLGAPLALVVIRGAGDQEFRTTANAEGSWSVDVRVIPGRNEFTISSIDPATSKQSNEVAAIVNVPVAGVEPSTAPSTGPSAGTATAAALTLTSPADGQTVDGGAVAIAGTTDAERILVSAAAAGPSASIDPSPAPDSSGAIPTAPAPKAIAVGEDGTFADTYILPEGSWTLTFRAEGAAVTPTTQTRSVAVQVDGLQLVIEIEGGAAWLLVRVDGEPAPGYAGGRTHRRGDRIEFSAQESISVRTGSSGATFFTFNGVDLGALGGPGIPETWVFDSQGHRKSG